MQWVEKYRPKKLGDFALDKITLNIFKNFTHPSGDNMTHILLNGSSGIGKTSLGYCVATSMGYPFREFNASDLRGIGTIEDILSFHTNTDKSKKKIIIMDEADNITRKAQELIISLMDTHVDNLIFIFTCNTIHNFIKAIIDRVICININKKQKNGMIHDRIKFILRSEDISCEDGVVNRVVEDAECDIRACINKLELLSKHHHPKTKHITIDMLITYNTNPSFCEIISVIKCLCVKDFRSVLDTYESYRLTGLNPHDFVISGIDMLSKYIDEIKSFMSDQKRIDMLTHLHLYNFKISSLGLFSEIHFFKLLYNLHAIGIGIDNVFQDHTDFHKQDEE